MAKRYNRTCGFCEKQEGEYYIYPLPKEYRGRLNMGLMACGKCAPAIKKAQFDEGILLPPDPPKIDTVSWKE